MARRFIHIASIKQLIKLLHKGEFSKEQIADKLGVRINTVCDWLTILHTKPENVVYISNWVRRSKVGPYTALWTFGYCVEDVPKPKPLSKKERELTQKLRGKTLQTDKGIKHVLR